METESGNRYNNFKQISKRFSRNHSTMTTITNHACHGKAMKKKGKMDRRKWERK